MNFFNTVLNSITNFAVYREYAKESTGRALRYLLLVFTLLFIGYALKLAPAVGNVFSNLGQEINVNVPDFRIVNGELEFKAKMPYIIKGDNNFILIVDTTGQLDETALNTHANGAFVGKTKAVIKDQQQGINTVDFTAFKGMEISKQSVLKFLPAIKKYIPLALALFYVFGFFAKLLTVLLLALIGLAIKGAASELKFNHMWGIACHALTLPMLLDLLKQLALPQLPGFNFIYFGIAVFYVYRGVKAAKEDRDDAGPVIPV